MLRELIVQQKVFGIGNTGTFWFQMTGGYASLHETPAPEKASVSFEQRNTVALDVTVSSHERQPPSAVNGYIHRATMTHGDLKTVSYMEEGSLERKCQSYQLQP